MAVQGSRTYTDVNAVIGGYLRDLAFAQSSQQKMFGYKRARQDLDHTLASRTFEAGCVIALDSDAHTTTQLWYAEIALAHARLVGIPADRIVNCWPLDRLLAWLSNPSAERRQ